MHCYKSRGWWLQSQYKGKTCRSKGTHRKFSIHKESVELFLCIFRALTCPLRSGFRKVQFSLYWAFRNLEATFLKFSFFSKFFFSLFIFFLYLLQISFLYYLAFHFISISYLFSIIPLKSKFQNLLNLKFKLNKRFQNQISIPTTDFNRFQEKEQKWELNPNVSQSAKIWVYKCSNSENEYETQIQVQHLRMKML
jgi:hypothetical protein